jgi:hypothetical protein
VVRAVRRGPDYEHVINYQLWPAKNRPCCWGLCLRGRNVWILALNFTLVLGITVMFFIFISPFVPIVVELVVLLLLMVVLYTLARTAFSDAGIIPRQPKPAQRPPSRYKIRFL